MKSGLSLIGEDIFSGFLFVFLNCVAGNVNQLAKHNSRQTSLNLDNRFSIRMNTDYGTVHDFKYSRNEIVDMKMTT